MILLRTWTGIAAHYADRRFEWVMGGGAFAMGLALTFQPDMFDLAPHYGTLHRAADEPFYAVLFFLCAVFRLVALGVNGTFAGFRLSPHLRALAALLGALLWAFFSLSFMVSAARYGTTFGPIVAYGIAAMVELHNVGQAAAAVGAWTKGRR